MLTIGSICMKIAGRDAGKLGVVIDIIDSTYVLLDGEVRRKKCNILHLEPMGKSVDVKKNATHADVLKALGIKEGKKKTGKKKDKALRPRSVNVKKKYATAKKAKAAPKKEGKAEKAKVAAKKKA